MRAKKRMRWEEMRKLESIAYCVAYRPFSLAYHCLQTNFEPIQRNKINIRTYVIVIQLPLVNW